MSEQPRYGYDRTEEERLARHQAMYGSESELPERGTGRRAKVSSNAQSQGLIWLAVVLGAGAVAVTVYVAWKENWI